MVDLPTGDQSGDVTAQAPQNRVSGRQYAMSGSYLARGLDQLSTGLNQVAVPLAEQQAAEDLKNTSVTRDAQGNLTVGTPPHMPILGPGGIAYDSAIAAGTLARGDNASSTDIAQLRAQHEGDPEGFQTAYTSYAKNIAVNNPGPLGATMSEAAMRQGTQYYGNMVQTQAIKGVNDAKGQIDTAMTAKFNQMADLAQQGGTDTEAFGTAAAEYNTLSKSLTSNPAFAVSAATQKQNDDAAFNQIRAYSVAGRVDADMKGPGGIQAARQSLHDAIMAPDSGLSPSEQNHFMAAGEARIQFNTGQNQAAVEANRANVEALDQAVKNPSTSTKLTEPIWQAAILNSQSTGDSTTTKRLEAMRQQWQYETATHTLAPNQNLNQQGLGAGPNPTVQLPPVTTPQGLATYKARVSQIESGGNPNAVSSAGATGVYQFIPSTAAKYGGNGDAAMNGLTADNRNALVSGLGREPTQAELYLAHQQGAQGAMKLMADPSRRAGDVVGDAAINGNGGNSKMTAGDFVNMWQAKFNKTAPPSANGIPYTQAQLTANPFLLSSAVRGIVSDPDNRLSYGTKLGDSIMTSVKNGFVPPPDVAANYMQLAQNEPRLADQAGKVNAMLTGSGIANDAINMPPGSGDAYMAHVHQLAAGGSLYQQEVAAQAKDFYEKGVEGLKKDPFGTAVAKGWDNGKGPPNPLDFSDPGNLAVALHQRSDLAASIAARTGNMNMGALAPDEVDQVKSQMDGPNALTIASALSTLPPQRMNATMAQLGEKGAAGQTLAIAGSLFKEAPDVAQDITQGYLLMRGEKGANYVPKAVDANTEMDKYIPNATFGIPAREGLMNAVTAVYAKMSSDARDTSGNLNSDRFQQSVDRVTGGVLSFHGGQLIAPQRGMAQGDFDGIASHIGDQDLLGAITLGGQPVTGAVFQNSARLENAGDGKYFVRLGNSDAKPVYAYSSNPTGQMSKFVLDLKNRPAQAPAYIEPTPGMMGN